MPRQTGRLTVGRNIKLRFDCVEAGSNTSTVALLVVKGDEKEVSNLRQQNMVANPTGLGLENDGTGEGQQQL
jgi:hypothetical protein